MTKLRLKALGDAAILAYLADESSALQFAAAVRTAGFPWLIEAVPAYASVGIYFDPKVASLRDARAALERLKPAAGSVAAGRSHVIPCCYEMGPDLARVAEHAGLTSESVIASHVAEEYAIYAIGFCPGFPYLGYLPPALQGVPRLPAPRLRVEPGSVGLTGRQTGVYPLARPGGWNLIGRTPLELVHIADGHFPLQIGDRVRFARIDAAEFGRRAGDRLER